MPFLHAQAQAEIFEASMKVTQAKDAFNKVNGSELRLSNNSHMSINIKYDDGDKNYDLKIYDIRPDQEGCTNYKAKLDRPEDEERVSGYWFFVDLVDYSSCGNEKKWRAFVRMGCNCCGTEDSTMTLIGNYEGSMNGLYAR